MGCQGGYWHSACSPQMGLAGLPFPPRSCLGWTEAPPKKNKIKCKKRQQRCVALRVWVGASSCDGNHVVSHFQRHNVPGCSAIGARRGHELFSGPGCPEDAERSVRGPEPRQCLQRLLLLTLLLCAARRRRRRQNGQMHVVCALPWGLGDAITGAIRSRWNLFILPFLIDE